MKLSNLLALKQRIRDRVRRCMRATVYATVRLKRALSTVQLHQCSGGFRNLERGVQPLAREAHPKILGLPRPLPARKRPNCISRSNSRPSQTSGDQ